MILNRVLRRAVRYFPNNTATIFNGQRQTYRELGRRVQALAAALSARGIQRNDHVAIYLLNSSQFLETVYACFEIGAVIVPLNTRLAADELVFIINDAECKAFITDNLLLPMAAGFKARLNGIEQFIAVGGGEGFTDYETLLAEHANSSFSSTEATSDEELAGLFYTSGTTGLPKGVMLSHRNLWMNALHTLATRAPEPNLNFLHAAPMFHLATFPAVINITVNGGTHTILQRFDLKAMMELIESAQVSSTVLVPTMVNFLIHHPDFNKHDLSSLHRVTYGAAPMPVELLNRAMAVLPNVEFSQGYGQTESSPLLTSLSHQDHITNGDERLLRRLASCGRPVAGVEIEIQKDDGTFALAGEVGEVIARGPNVMMGYWKRPEETAATLRDGWLHTGDMGMADEDGYIYLVDRKKDMIISGGENVYSSEVENIVYQHPSVREAAVIGVPDDRWGEAVTAIVTLKPNTALTETELTEFCAARLADYKVPKRVEIREDELPKSGTGKIMKKELREPYWQGRNRRVN
ncbi:MAG: long-chain-fatty-acid--CoA ligase [Blastocatellia bacterium]